MSLLFLLTYYYPHWTGLTQYAKALGEGLVKRGWKIDVLTTRHREDLPLKETINGIRIKREPVIFRISRSVVSISLLLCMVKEVYKCDQVVIFLPFAEVVWATTLAKIMNKRVFLVYNGDLVLPAGRSNRLMERIFDLTTGWAIKLSDGVIVNTSDYAKMSRVLSNNPNKWIKLVPPIRNAVPKNGDVEELQKIIGLKGNKVIGFAGRFVEEKGFDILLKSIPLIKKRVKNALFVFAGETKIGYEKFFEKNRKCIEKEKENLVILGKLQREKMWAFYKICDVLVISSRSDFFPFVQVEAMLSGVPIVVTDIPGARWLVKTTGMGEIVPVEDPQKLAEGIIKVLEDPTRYIKHKQKVEQIFDYEKLMNKYDRIFK